MSALIADTNKKEPLLLKRFMGYAEQPPRDGRFRTAIDSASQKISVTVRQMFSADPAPGKPGRLSGTSAVSPFSDGGSLALPTGTDESRASISQRFNFRGSALHRDPRPSTDFSHLQKFLAKYQKIRPSHRTILWGMAMEITGRAAPRSPRQTHLVCGNCTHNSCVFPRRMVHS